MALTPQLLQKTEHFARDILENQLPAGYSYHTIDHTLEVLQACDTIANYIQLPEQDRTLLKLAGWLHDLGYRDQYIGHEEVSMKIAREFLGSQNLEEEHIRQIEAIIEATRLDQPPRSLLEEVIKDADLSNLATPDALENSEKIRSEWASFLNRSFTDEGWNKFNHRFYKEYIYYTTYGKDVLEPGKTQNVKKLKKRLRKTEKKANEEARIKTQLQIAAQTEKINKLTKKLKKLKKQQPDRGIETMFRVTYRTHINLSSIADNKANILLSINAIIISVVFGSILADSDNPNYVLWPAFLQLGVSLGTMIFAILSTRPKVNSLSFSRDDIIQKKTNLLFFGNFHNISLKDYQWGINEMMKDSDYLYGTMSKDIYFLGVVLAKKFRLLRFSYNIFMYGMIGVVVFALIIFLIFPDRATGL
ncbi:MAG: Pycsar system effector family protein [Bacteroidota bacterium]